MLRHDLDVRVYGYRMCVRNNSSEHFSSALCLKVRKKFSNANPTSLAIAKAARAQEWSRLFGFEGT